MKTQVKNVANEEFMSAVDAAASVSKTVYPNTKLAYYCTRFLEFNKQKIKDHEKFIKSSVGALQKELHDVQIDNCVEKDGKLFKDEKGNYQYAKAGEKLVAEKVREVTKKTDEIVEKRYAEEIQVKVIVSGLSLPADIDHAFEKALNGFVYTNVNPFEEAEENQDIPS